MGAQFSGVHIPRKLRRKKKVGVCIARQDCQETGFVETLTPQYAYTPGQALSPGIGFNVEEHLTNLQQATEIDRLQAEIRDLTEKLETLRVKRSQDKEKLKDQDKTRLQLEQLLEFKGRIMESQASLQRDLARARQETREAVEARERHADEMADLAETVEMATLDKEMAEEKELLRAEMSAQGGGEDNNKVASTVAVQRIKKVHSMLLKYLLRVETAHQKHESQNLQKELDVSGLSARQEEKEQQIADLLQQAKREREAAQETLADREQTISKFRELVQQLQEQCQELQENLQKESSKPMSALPEIKDFKKMFAESKAHTKAIDLELRRIDVEQANQHVHYLTAYMPESFMARGGDHDAMLLLLLLPRLLRKADILVAQVRDKFATVASIDRTAVLRSHAVEQFSFRSRLSFCVYSLQSLLQQLLRSLHTCSPDVLLRVGVLYSELSLQERSVDSLVELLRRDQLDENVSLEGLERFLAFCQSVITTHLPEAPTDQPQQLSSCCRALSAACDALYTDSSSLLALVQSGQHESGVCVLLCEVMTGSDTVRQQLKQCRRRLPQEGGSCGVKVCEMVRGLQKDLEPTAKLVRALQKSVRACLQHLTAAGDMEAGVSVEKVLELVHNAVDHVQDGEDQGAPEWIRASLQQLQKSVSALALALQDAEYDTEPRREEKGIAPIVLRAQQVKKELEETKMLKQKLETRETDIKELKKALKLKQEELSEMVIRKELAESKLGNVHKDYGLNIEKLQRKFDDCQLLLKRKEKEFEETMDHLQADIDSLESERGELKERLKSISKKALIEGLAKSVVSVTSSNTAFSPSGPSLPVTVRDSPLLIQEIRTLRLALQHANHQVFCLKNANALATLRRLPPLKVDAALGAEEMVESPTTKNLNLEERVKELEEAVADLKALPDKNEQLQEGSCELELEPREELDLAHMAMREREVDAALGAEEMVESLTTKNLNLEERVKELEEAVADLEALSDMNEQLQEGSRELELELREELDLAHMAKREAQREREAAQETLADREQTISKFRELVQRLQEQCQELQENLQKESSKPVSALPEMIDFKSEKQAVPEDQIEPRRQRGRPKKGQEKKTKKTLEPHDYYLRERK